MKRLPLIVSIVTVLTTAGVIGLAIAGIDTPEPLSPSQPLPEVVMVEGVDHLPSETAADWVTYADHVVVVNAVSEISVPPTQIELDRGEGLIGRIVTLEISEILWSREGAPVAPPDTWDYSAIGAQFTEGNTAEPYEMALHERPRVEVGHSYVMAIRWEPERCEDGESEPAQWRGLGEGSEIPYDDAALGNGELEGEIQSPQQFGAAAEEDVTVGGLEEQVAGQSADALVAELESAVPAAAPEVAVDTFSTTSDCA
ncbi:hypothetical protein O1R50_18885 [Glycomyces luteolus]|uniref:Uncharacterized protein n=1 Tax=Glycomyces luteolus TaxID=2670330 RepID=A0A9X3PAA1_9ACTN|nr:hypothetical protein [Glycomyces luteolus]MDA1361701.1 hypothetical protein [Glycomyces luteolus]